MADGATLLAVDDVLGRALARLMTHLVALEAHLFGAVEGVVRVFAAEDARWLLCLVGTLASQVAKLAAVMALYSNVRLSPVTPAPQLLHSIEQIFFIVIRSLLAIVLFVRHLCILFLFRFTFLFVPSMVFIAAYELSFTTDENVRIEAR